METCTSSAQGAVELDPKNGSESRWFFAASFRCRSAPTLIASNAVLSACGVREKWRYLDGAVIGFKKRCFAKKCVVLCKTSYDIGKERSNLFFHPNFIPFKKWTTILSSTSTKASAGDFPGHHTPAQHRQLFGPA